MTLQNLEKEINEKIQAYKQEDNRRRYLLRDLETLIHSVESNYNYSGKYDSQEIGINTSRYKLTLFIEDKFDLENLKL